MLRIHLKFEVAPSRMTRPELCGFLTSINIPFDEKATKPILYALVREHRHQVPMLIQKWATKTEKGCIPGGFGCVGLC